MIEQPAVDRVSELQVAAVVGTWAGRVVAAAAELGAAVAAGTVLAQVGRQESVVVAVAVVAVCGRTTEVTASRAEAANMAETYMSETVAAAVEVQG